MRRDEIVAALRRLRVETGSLACFGCGREHNCGTHGCRIMREAGDLLENDRSQILALQRELALKQAQLDCAASSAGKLRRKAREWDWISVEERLPDAMTWVLCFCRDGMLRILRYDNLMDDWDMTARNRCFRREHVKHWMPLPPGPEAKKELEVNE